MPETHVTLSYRWLPGRLSLLTFRNGKACVPSVSSSSFLSFSILQSFSLSHPWFWHSFVLSAHSDPTVCLSFRSYLVPRGCCDKLRFVAIMGRSFASLFTGRPAAQGFKGPLDREPDYVQEKAWERQSFQAKPDRPLINLNAPANPVSLVTRVVVGSAC